jgi:hypothetical protein
MWSLDRSTAVADVVSLSFFSCELPDSRPAAINIATVLLASKETLATSLCERHTRTSSPLSVLDYVPTWSSPAQQHSSQLAAKRVNERLRALANDAPQSFPHQEGAKLRWTFMLFATV